MPNTFDSSKIDLEASSASSPWLQTGGNLVRRVFANRNGPLLLALLAYIAIIALIEPNFLSPYNVRNVLLQVSVAGIVTIGMTLMIIAGQIDLSVGFLVSLSATVMATLLQMDVHWVWVVLSGMGLCVFAQGLTGFVVARLKLESFIITLGMMAIYRGIGLLMTSGGEIPLDSKFELLGRSRLFLIPTPVYIFVGLCLIFWFILHYTVFGRQLFAVGENNKAAYLSGINIRLFKVKIYILHGMLVGIASMILMSRIGVGSPNMAAGLELNTIAAAVVGGAALSGGRGSIFGSFLGVLYLGIISNSMNIIGVSTFWQYIMLGSVVITAVIIGNLNKEDL